MIGKRILLSIFAIGAIMVSLVACSVPKEVTEQNVKGNNIASVSVSSPAPETGIQYSYVLALDDDLEGEYQTNQNDVNYNLIYYGEYITVYITNSGDCEATIGGEYYLQRFIDGEYVDLEDNNNLIRCGVHVKDMPLIILHDQADGSEIILSNEDEQFTIYPGQTINAEFLTMRYPISDDPSYAGAYRFVYGDVMIEFKLICDIAC